MEGNDDLFWAAMGGSPGNYGILTHVLFRPLHDKDYPDSRMMKAVTNYSPEKHYQCEQLLAEMSNDVNFPRNWDYGITIGQYLSLNYYMYCGYYFEYCRLFLTLVNSRQ